MAGVTFSSAMHSLIALAPGRHPAHASVILADERALPQARRLRASGEWLALHRRTGTPVHPMSPLVKLLWFREEEPEVCRRAAHWVGIKEDVLLRLTGVLAVDESIASATGLYGLAARDWDDEALALAGVRRDQLPSLCSTTDVVSRLGPAGRRWGLPSGTPVVAGASDGVLANLGVGAVAPGVAACSIGTSAAIRGVVAPYGGYSNGLRRRSGLANLDREVYGRELAQWITVVRPAIVTRTQATPRLTADISATTPPLTARACRPTAVVWWTR